ncbi:MAG: hypothetical protein AB7F19_04250 [Candidatus Babeliales bacterium]
MKNIILSIAALLFVANACAGDLYVGQSVTREQQLPTEFQTEQRIETQVAPTTAQQPQTVSTTVARQAYVRPTQQHDLLKGEQGFDAQVTREVEVQKTTLPVQRRTAFFQ